MYTVYTVHCADSTKHRSGGNVHYPNRFSNLTPHAHTHTHTHTHAQHAHTHTYPHSHEWCMCEVVWCISNWKKPLICSFISVCVRVGRHIMFKFFLVHCFLFLMVFPLHSPAPITPSYYWTRISRIRMFS